MFLPVCCKLAGRWFVITHQLINCPNCGYTTLALNSFQSRSCKTSTERPPTLNFSYQMFPAQRFIYVWGRPCVWCCLTRLCFLAPLAGIRSKRTDSLGGGEAVSGLRASSGREKCSRVQVNTRKRGKRVTSSLSGEMHFIWSKTDTITVHKALLFPARRSSVSHIWCLCLDSRTIKSRWYVIYIVLWSGGDMVPDDDKWTECSYDMFKIHRALLTVRGLLFRAQRFWPWHVKKKHRAVSDALWGNAMLAQIMGEILHCDYWACKCVTDTPQAYFNHNVQSTPLKKIQLHYDQSSKVTFLVWIITEV